MFNIASYQEGYTDGYQDGKKNIIKVIQAFIFEMKIEDPDTSHLRGYNSALTDLAEYLETIEV
jgi:hypothetical protein